MASFLDAEVARLLSQAEQQKASTSTSTKTSSSSSGSSASVPSGGSTGKWGTQLNPEQLATILRKAGFSSNVIPHMVAASLAESGGWSHRPSSVDLNADGTPFSWGLFQINVNAHPWFDKSRLNDLEYQAQAAKRIYDQQGLRAWSVTHENRGAPYRQYLPAGMRAVGAKDVSLPDVPNVDLRQLVSDSTQRGQEQLQQAMANLSMRNAMTNQLGVLDNIVGEGLAEGAPSLSDLVYRPDETKTKLQQSFAEKMQPDLLYQEPGEGKVSPIQQLAKENRVAEQQGGNIMQMPFFDPGLAELQRQIALQTTQGVADLNLRKDRLIEDQNLFRPYLERRFGQQAQKTAANAAGRGFHGTRQGITSRLLGKLGEEQAFALGEFERRGTRGLEDIERAIARLSESGIREGAEGTRRGAANASQGQYPVYAY